MALLAHDGVDLGAVRPRHDGEMLDIEIEGDMIRPRPVAQVVGRGGFGADARELLRARVVTVNGDREGRRSPG
jgi:hypothetical protein